jgi:transcription elongation factor Elf1
MSKVKKIKKLKFTCPDCNGYRLECVETGIISSEITNLDEDGDFDYDIPIIEDSEGIISFQCADCGYQIRNKNNDLIIDNLDLIEWLKDHNKKE